MITYKNPQEIASMRQGGSILAKILNELEKNTHAGISTKELDDLASELCLKYKVTPAFKGYNRFPSSVCISINDEIVHGLPKENKIIKNGDIVSLDFGVIKNGFCTDSAITYSVGNIDKNIKKLIEVTKQSLQLAINECVVGNKIGNVSFAVQEFVEKNGFNVIKNLVGHGIGKHVHEEPQVPNYGRKNEGVELKEGMTIAIEPMVTVGRDDIVALSDDGWTFVTKDAALCAHFEHTVAITKSGPIVLTI